LLLLIALFVYLGAEAENRLVRMRDVIGDLPVKDAMITQFTTLSPDDTLADAVRLLLAGSQQDFPVVRDGKLAGMLFRQDLTEKLAAEGDQATVARAMRTEIGQTTESEPLERVLDRMADVAGSTLPVLKQGAVVGLLTTENIGELIMVRSALRRDTPPATHLGDAIPDGRGG
jgi:CBS domain-containing protein